MDFSNIIVLLNGLQEKILELQAALVDADAFARAQYDAGYAKGLEDGKALGGGDVQAQIDAAVAAAVGPLNAQISELMLKIDELNAKLSGLEEAAAQVPTLIAEAVKAENDRVMSHLDNAEAVVSDSLNKLQGAVLEAAIDLKNKIRLA